MGSLFDLGGFHLYKSSTAQFDQSTGVAVNAAGTVYVADTDNNTIRAAVVPMAPAITSQPQSQTIAAGINMQVSFIATRQPAPTYQWSLNGSTISGATGATLNLASGRSSDPGNYSITVSNNAETVTRNNATLTVNAASGAAAKWEHRS